MSKRKSSADPSRGFNTPGRRPSIPNIQARAFNIIHRRSGATNVRSNARTHTDPKRGSDANVPTDRKFSATRNLQAITLPKTRIGSASDRNIYSPRLKQFPAESVKKSNIVWSASKCSMPQFADRDASKYVEVSRTNAVPSHPYGDSAAIHPIEQPISQPQRQIQSEQHSDKVPNHSELAILDKRVPSFITPVYRSFEPNMTNGVMAPESSANDVKVLPSRPLTQQYSARSTQESRGLQGSIPQVVSSPPQQSTHQDTWKIDDSQIVPDYEKQPIGGRSAVRYLESVQNEKPVTQPQAAATGQPSINVQSPSNIQAVQQRENAQHREPQKEQLHQRVQNIQQMYQQIQDNTARQQKMTVPGRQQIETRPFTHQFQTPAQQASVLISPQSFQANQTTIPHHEMLMQHRHAKYQTPQYDWTQNRALISDPPGARKPLNQFAVDLVPPDEKNIHSAANAVQYERSQQHNVQSKADQRVMERSAGVQWQQQVPHQRYEMSNYQYSPIQQEPSNSVPSQRLFAAQQQRPTPVMKAQAVLVDRHQQQSQQQRMQQPMSMDQQSRPVPQFDQTRAGRQPQVAKKNYPEFTPAMIRDQELLLTNMRQQKIPENIMRRQFDALLNEQRRYLTYLNQGDSDDIKQEIPLRKRSRVSYEDQRPEWMGRITPARFGVRQVQKFSDGPSQLNVVRENQAQHQSHLEHAKQFDQGLQQVSQLAPQYSTTVPHQSQDLVSRATYQLRQTPNLQCGVNSPTSASFPIPSPAQALSSQHAALISSQQRGSSQLNRYYNSVHHRHCHQVKPSEGLQHQQQYQSIPEIWNKERMNQAVQMQDYQQQHLMNNFSPQLRMQYAIPEQVQQRDETMGQESLEKGDYGLKIDDNQRKRDELSSLLKLREYKKYIRPQKQNNGLQDMETVKKALEALKCSDVNKKGFGYVEDSGKKTTVVRLNGTQDPKELENIPPPPLEYLQRLQQQQQPQISANGLCNFRNPNNPAPLPKSFPENTNRSLLSEYPRQLHRDVKPPTQIAHQDSQKMMAEKENGSAAGNAITMRQHDVCPLCHQTIPVQVLPQGKQHNSVNASAKWSANFANQNERIKAQGDAPLIPYKFDGTEPQYRQQMEQFYRNRQNLKSSGELVASREAGQESTLVTGNVVSGTTRSPPENERTINQHLWTQQGDHGQPEIREPKLIGGLTYLARKVDQTQNSPLIASNASITGKFLQPLVEFN